MTTLSAAVEFEDWYEDTANDVELLHFYEANSGGLQADLTYSSTAKQLMWRAWQAALIRERATCAAVQTVDEIAPASSADGGSIKPDLMRKSLRKW